MNNDRKSKLKEAIKRVREQFEKNVLSTLEQHDDWTYDRVAQHVGLSTAVVQRISSRAGKSRPVGPRPTLKNESTTADPSPNSRSENDGPQELEK